MGLLQDIMQISNEIKFYEKNSSNPFKKIIAGKKKSDLCKKVNSLKDSNFVDRNIIKEFVEFYNASFDIIQLDNISTHITDRDVYLLKLISKDGTIFIGINNKPNNADKISIIIRKNNEDKERTISCTNRLSKDGDYSTLVGHINEMVEDIIIVYLKKYILGGKNNGIYRLL